MTSKAITNIKLLTGIPRSGTTLCCNLLNQCENTVALHEPIDPQKLTSIEPATAVQEIALQIKNIRASLENNQAIEHGDSAGIELDNPVGLDTDDKGLRKQRANRGKVVLPQIDDATTLFVKQNALFTALASELQKHYPITAIVRNPIDVLLSWMTVDLPVNKGTLPAGEKYDNELADRLNRGTVLGRQVIIYDWFLTRFTQANLTVVRYEDIISTSGTALYDTVGIEHSTPLTPIIRKFPKEVVNQLQQHWPVIRSLGFKAGYDAEFLHAQYIKHINSQ